MLLNGVRVVVVVGGVWAGEQVWVGAFFCTLDIIYAQEKRMYEWQWAYRRAVRREQNRPDNTRGKTEAVGSGDNTKRGSNNDPLWVSYLNINLFEYLAHRRLGSGRACVKSA